MSSRNKSCRIHLNYKKTYPTSNHSLMYLSSQLEGSDHLSNPTLNGKIWTLNDDDDGDGDDDGDHDDHDHDDNDHDHDDNESSQFKFLPIQPLFNVLFQSIPVISCFPQNSHKKLKNS